MSSSVRVVRKNKDVFLEVTGLNNVVFMFKVDQAQLKALAREINKK